MSYFSGNVIFNLLELLKKMFFLGTGGGGGGCREAQIFLHC